MPRGRGGRRTNVSLVYHDHASRIEFDFEVAAGADPRAIAMVFEADEVAIAPDGSLRLRAGGEELHFDAPELFQKHGREREPVVRAYRIDEDGGVGLAVGSYDCSRPLVIDPVVLGLASRLGGSAFDGRFDGVVNFMVFDGSIPLHVIELLGQGVVAFGFVERNNWTPSNGDGEDLFGLQFNASADRVFATVDAFGHVELSSAAPFDPGLLVAEGSVDLDPGRVFSLVIDVGGSNAQLLYDGVVVAEGNPFSVSSSDADPAQIGDDQVISVSFGTEFRGSATINDVPESGGTLMLLAGAAALAGLGRRRIRP